MHVKTIRIEIKFFIALSPAVLPSHAHRVQLHVDSAAQKGSRAVKWRAKNSAWK
jgi:hypothetical protein